MDGQSGYIILENRGDVVIAPQISFVTIGGKGEQFVWKIDDIVEIKKVRLNLHCSRAHPSFLSHLPYLSQSLTFPPNQRVL